MRAFRVVAGRFSVGVVASLALASLIFASGLPAAGRGQSTGGSGSSSSTTATTGLGTTGLGTTGLGTGSSASTSATSGGTGTTGSDGGTLPVIPGYDPTRRQGDPRDDRVPQTDDGRGVRSPRIGRVGEFRGYGAPRVYESGPFEGLESYGYDFFAPGREALGFGRDGRPLPPRARTGSNADADRNRDRGANATSTENDERRTDSRTDARDQGPANPLGQFVGPRQGAQNVAIPAPERYQLGPGDRISVRFSSPTYEATERRLTVDATGNVVAPFTGRRITVRGLTVAQVERVLAREISRSLRNAEVTVTLSELRPIAISVVGEVVAPGSYNAPATTTVFNALYAAGGPTFEGSFRRIQLRRANGTSRTIDLYRYLIKGDPSQDVPLQPGDLILVPSATGRVAVRGEVNRPAVYELLPTETLRDLLSYAGGSLPTAVRNRVQVGSVRAGVARQLVNVDLTDPRQNPVLQEGDVVELFPVREELANAVSIEGPVDQPRTYALFAGETVADLIESARGLLPEAYGARADLFRELPDRTRRLIPIDLPRAIARDPQANIALQPNDRLVVYRSDEVRFLEDRRVEVRGAVRRPQSYDRAEGTRVLDVILQAGGLLPNASPIVFVQRRNPDGTEGPLLRVDVRQAAADPGNDQLLADRDVVTVFRTDEAQFVPEQRVAISGAVQRPGEYPRSANLTLRALIEFAGGLLPNAGTQVQVSKSRVERGTPAQTFDLQAVLAGTQDVPLADGDVISIPSNGAFQERPMLVSIQGRVKTPGVYQITGKERLSDLVRMAGGALDEGWLPGAQFARDPEALTTDAAARLTPRAQQILANVQRQEYLRALAKSDIDKLRAILGAANSSGGGLSLGAGGLLGGSSVPAQLPPGLGNQLFNRETVTPARELTEDEQNAFGNVPIRLDEAVKHKGSYDDVELRDGDILTVPGRPTTVQVRGAVAVPSPIVFKPNQNLRYYLDQVGGLSRDADERMILIIRATGTITRARPSTKILLGDTIYVPTKVISAKLTDSSNGIETFFRAITNTAVLLAVFRSIGL